MSVYAEAVEAVDDLLGVLKSPVLKALDPLKRKDFDTIVDRVSSKLDKAAKPDQVAALKAAMLELDIDWPSLTDKQHTAAIEASRKALSVIPDEVLPRLEQVFETEGKSIVKRTRAATKKKFKLKIATKLNATDEKIIEHAKTAQSLFVRDMFGDRIDETSKKAREIVADGLEKGLGQKEIANDLQAGIKGLWGQNRHYYDVVASNFSNRARTFAQLSSFEEAAIEEYVFDAVLDERTSDACRFMHGKRFPVSTPLKQFSDMAEADKPEEVKDIAPWLLRGKEKSSGDDILYIKNHEKGTKTKVATITRSGVGSSDDKGSYKRSSMTTGQLEAAGVTMPPLHGLCRSTIVPA